MKRRLIPRLGQLWIIPLFLFAFGCATTRVPIYLNESFGQDSIDDIFVVSVLDLRFNKEKELDLDKWVHNMMKRHLEKKKYMIMLVRDRALVEGITEEDLTKTDPDWVKSLGPSDARWVILPILYDVSSKLTFGSTGNAELGAILYDKDNAAILWRDKTVAQVGQGGLIGMAMKGTMERSAIETATIQLIKSFPRKK